MRDDRYAEVLDELYFICSFDQLKNALSHINDLKKVVWCMVELGLVKIMVNFDEEIELNKEDYEVNLGKYHYIASKKGLIWHNSL
jgi:hypothetical protein